MSDELQASIDRRTKDYYGDWKEYYLDGDPAIDHSEQRAADNEMLADAYVALMASSPVIDETITLNPKHAELRSSYSDIILLIASSNRYEWPSLELGKRYRLRVEGVVE